MQATHLRWIQLRGDFSGESLPSKDPDLSSYLHTKIAGHLKIAALLIKYLKKISIPPGNQQYAYC